MKKLSGFVDCAGLSGTIHLTPDVCVVGSGAGGAVAAATLQAAGYDVLVVEEGGHYTRRDFRMREDSAYPELYQEDAGRTTEDLALTVLQGRAVGGSTTINWTTCFRTPEDVVEHWRRVHGVRGFTHADLLPHWEAMEARLSIATVSDGLVNPNNRTLLDGCRALGYEAQLTRRNVKSCANSGYCGLGCPVDAKQSMLVTCLPDLVAHGGAVLSRCRIERLEYAGRKVRRLHGTLLGADDRTPTGASVVIEPRRVILAGGGVQTPAILLRSGVAHHGHVGARTFLHPTVAMFGRYPYPISGWYGAPQSVTSHHFAHRKDGLGYFLETSPVHPMLGALAAPGIGADHAEQMANLPYVSGHIALVIDGFTPQETGGRVKLRASGHPVLDYPLTRPVLDALREASKTLARVQLASGATESRSSHDPPCVIRTEKDVASLDRYPFGPNRLTLFSAHVMGGSAMNDDPARGVVDSETLALHALDDVHVIDGSVFPTSLGVNPQLSIYGLARLMATRLASKWKTP